MLLVIVFSYLRFERGEFMDIIEIINKKRLGKILSKKELEYVVTGYLDGEI